jgi:hypothetical protein
VRSNTVSVQPAVSVFPGPWCGRQWSGPGLAFSGAFLGLLPVALPSHSVDPGNHRYAVLGSAVVANFGQSGARIAIRPSVLAIAAEFGRSKGDRCRADTRVGRLRLSPVSRRRLRRQVRRGADYPPRARPGLGRRSRCRVVAVSPSPSPRWSSEAAPDCTLWPAPSCSTSGSRTRAWRSASTRRARRWPGCSCQSARASSRRVTLAGRPPGRCCGHRWCARVRWRGRRIDPVSQPRDADPGQSSNSSRARRSRSRLSSALSGCAFSSRSSPFFPPFSRGTTG